METAVSQTDSRQTNTDRICSRRSPVSGFIQLEVLSRVVS